MFADQSINLSIHKFILLASAMNLCTNINFSMNPLILSENQVSHFFSCQFPTISDLIAVSDRNTNFKVFTRIGSQECIMGDIINICLLLLCAPLLYETLFGRYIYCCYNAEFLVPMHMP